MHPSLSQLMENSVQIAWEYLERSGQLGDPNAATTILSRSIEDMIRRGETSRLVLSNRAIAAYLRQHDNVFLFPG